ncbi:hypothetical protein EIP86_010415 [Pleurotus ostreatoroseus]|nr:hypothetical protein EIP86_010415 [Pleurotus ostreatoroseus]
MARMQSSDPPLPFDILIMIKMLIPITDLRTHVCFYNTCRAIALLYGTPDEEEAFWEKSCRLCGIHMMDCDDPGQLETCRTWKEVAFDCIAKDGFCNHPFCGDALLQYNAVQIADTVKRIPQWDPETACDSQVIGTKQPFVHPIFMFIGYSPSGAPEAEDIQAQPYFQQYSKPITFTYVTLPGIPYGEAATLPVARAPSLYGTYTDLYDLNRSFPISMLLGYLNYDWSFLLEQPEVREFAASHQTSPKQRRLSDDPNAVCSLREFVHLFEPSISYVLHRVYHVRPPPWRYFALFVTRKSKEMEQIYYNPRNQGSLTEGGNKSFWKRVRTLPVVRHYLPRTKALAEPQLYSTEDIARVITSFHSH